MTRVFYIAVSKKNNRVFAFHVMGEDGSGVIKWAKENARCRIERKSERIEELKVKLTETLETLKDSKADLTKLEEDHPEP